ncbi:hypothetical protein ACFLQI_01965 [Candidatus Undinarchaeota archaeon]
MVKEIVGEEESERVIKAREILARIREEMSSDSSDYSISGYGILYGETDLGYLSLHFVKDGIRLIFMMRKDTKRKHGKKIRDVAETVEKIFEDFLADGSITIEWSASA